MALIKPQSNIKQEERKESATTTANKTTAINQVQAQTKLKRQQELDYCEDSATNEHQHPRAKLINNSSNNNNKTTNNIHSDNKQDNTNTTTGEEQQQQKQQQVTPTETGIVKKLIVDCLIYFIRFLISIYDLISTPIFYFKHEVYKKQHEIDEVQRSKQLDPEDPNSPWVQNVEDSLQDEVNAKIDSFETYDELMQHSFKAHGDSPCYGVRQLLEEHWVKRPESDKLMRQVKLSDYKWVTYAEFERQIEAARKGFILEGVRSGDKVIMYADTRFEWQIACQALIRLGAVVATMYSTLGVDGIVHSVNETGVSHIVTQKDKVNKLLRLKGKLEKLSKIIYFEPVLKLPSESSDSDNNTDTDKDNDNDTDKSCNGKDTNNSAAATGGQWAPEFEHKDVAIMSFGHLLFKGQAASESEVSKLLEEDEDEDNSCASEEGEKKDKRKRSRKQKRDKDSIAVIMFTSGSTGIPKGVLISHKNILAILKSFTYVTKDIVHKPKDNVCTAYLPLAHIFEFLIESVMLYHGVKFGFATPHTLTDKSPGLMPGQTGDLALLKPTVMIIVPLILDRIVAGVKQALKAQSYFKEQLVSHLIKYKIYWMQKHYETPLVDKIVCSKMRQALGGRAKYVICGSAPLSTETQAFVRAALNIKLPQGFGTTETCAGTACQMFDDQTLGNVGLPILGCQVKLDPWLEGNYRPTDKPNPRGEIVVGGDMITQGYFNLEEQTKEVYYTDEKGVRWYRTGDIGEFLPNGNLKIIDRKKDLVKLQNGEYISLGKVESTLKSNPYTDNFCVYANSNFNYIVALSPANEQAIKTLAQQLVDEYARRNSPSMVARNEERKALLMSESEQAEAIEQLKEILASYESDAINNNASGENEQDRNMDRKMSSLSTNSAVGGSAINERLKQLCDNKLVHQRVLSQIRRLAQERNLMTLEVPKKLLLLAEEWTEDKNLVTAAMKIRRNYIYKRYEHELNQLYGLAK